MRTPDIAGGLRPEAALRSPIRIKTTGQHRLKAMALSLAPLVPQIAVGAGSMSKW